MFILIACICIIVFLIQIVLLIKCFKKKQKWSNLIIFELISILVSFEISSFYDSLPGYGIMPGLTYIGEIWGSFFFMILYILMLGITLLTKIVQFLIRKKKEKNKVGETKK